MPMRRYLGLAACLVLFAAPSAIPAPAWAVAPSEMLSDPAEEARARDIARQLRCLVCQNESIDTSEASFAHDMRMLIRDRLRQGQSDEQIVAYIRDRYGDFVLLQPPLTRRTALLWAAPGLALAAGCAMVWHAYRRGLRRRGPRRSSWPSSS